MYFKNAKIFGIKGDMKEIENGRGYFNDKGNFHDF
jgi:hypothetical protein